MNCRSIGTAVEHCNSLLSDFAHMKVARWMWLMSGALGLSPVLAQNSDTTRVLFVGNSYTYYNLMPEMFMNLARSAGRCVEVGMSVGGGYSLEFHSSYSQTISNISGNRWNYVVLQEHSLVPTIDYYRWNSMYPAARYLDSVIRANGGKTVFFMTWGRKYGGIQCINSYCSPTFKDFSQMQDALNEAYISIANELSAVLCPVGMAWKLETHQNPSSPLWEEDGSHPTFEGSYLAACTFYTVLFDANPEGLDYFAGLNRLDAIAYQRVAYRATQLYLSRPSTFTLYQNYPNPFNDHTTITFSVPRRSPVAVEIYNLLGQKVGSPVQDERGPGTFDLEFYTKGVSSGVYIYRLEYEGSSKTKKMTVVK